MQKYQRLSYAEREEIRRKLSGRSSLRRIAMQLKRNVSGICREIRAGICNIYTYREVKAQKRSLRNAAKLKKGQYKLDQNLDKDKISCNFFPESIP